MVYLDNNATAPLDPRVLAEMLPFLERLHANPSSLHRMGRVTRGAVETAREQVAALVNARPDQVIFTSGGTEANNLAVKGVAGKHPVGRCAFGATEHPSVVEPMMRLVDSGWDVSQLPVARSGAADRESIGDLCGQGLRFVSLMWANNETGVVNDVPAWGAFARSRNLLIHTDAVQACGRVPVDFAASGVHLMTVSSHKLHGPQGAGALVIDPAVEVSPLIAGGGQERGMRAGTENVAAIVGFGKAAELASSELNERASRWRVLQQSLEAALVPLDGTCIFGLGAERIPNTVQFAIRGIDGETLLMILDRKGIAVSSGSACASGAREPSPVLTAMGVAADLALGAVRVSFGIQTTAADVERLIASVKEIAGVTLSRVECV